MSMSCGGNGVLYITIKCKNCQKEKTVLYKDRHHVFCSKSCVTSYKNKHRVYTKEMRKNKSERLKQFYKDNPDILEETRKQLAEARKNIKKIPRAWTKTPKPSKEQMKKIYGKSGKLNNMYGRAPINAGRGKQGFREDLGHHVRSTWEANFAKILIFKNRMYKYESKRFTIIIDGKTKTYCPDFLINNNIYFEIVGYLDESHTKKINSFREQYPSFKLIVIGKNEYNKLINKYKNRITFER